MRPAYGLTSAEVVSWLKQIKNVKNKLQRQIFNEDVFLVILCHSLFVILIGFLPLLSVIESNRLRFKNFNVSAVVAVYKRAPVRYIASYVQ